VAFLRIELLSSASHYIRPGWPNSIPYLRDESTKDQNYIKAPVDPSKTIMDNKELTVVVN
jgi:hypothetical protein